eukprot:scaffold21440_cov48-Prasinocladus_malaysianus.AAC.1
MIVLLFICHRQSSECTTGQSTVTVAYSPLKAIDGAFNTNNLDHHHVAGYDRNRNGRNCLRSVA